MDGAICPLDQVEDATSDIDVGQDLRFGCGALRAVRFGKSWRQGLPECYVERLDALNYYYYALSDMRAVLVSIREGLIGGTFPHLVRRTACRRCCIC
jgi:hypothetical protein